GGPLAHHRLHPGPATQLARTVRGFDRGGTKKSGRGLVGASAKQQRGARVTTILPPVSQTEWERWQRCAAIVAVSGCAAFAVIGLVLYFLGGLPGPVQFFLSYLVAYNFWLEVALGSLVILMLQYVTGGAWGFVIRRVLESGTRTLLLLAVLFIPILLGMRFLYEWAQPDLVAVSENLQHKRPYLNVPFFIIRAILYFVIWLALTFFLNRWSASW